MSTQRSTILITGLVLIVIGGIILVLGTQNPNPLSNTVGTIFALFGTGMNYLQLFFRFPIDFNRPEEPSHPLKPIDSVRPEEPSLFPKPIDSVRPEEPSLFPKPPISGVFTYFRLSGIVLITGSIIFAAISLLPYSFYSQTTLSSEINLINAITLLLFSLGLPALPLKQSFQTRWLGLSGVAVLCISSLLLVILGFTLNDPRLRDYPYLLDYAAYGTQVIGNILLGIALIRASTFPRWTGVFLIISGIFYIGGFFPISLLPDTTAYYILSNVANLSGCIAFIRCGYTLLQNKENATKRSTSRSLG